MRGRDTLLLKPYGFADLEFDVPTPNDALYEIGSVTKQFTAAAILQLQEQGKLSLADDITKFLPDYPTQGHHITLRRLMDHTSGIKGYTEMPEFGRLMVQQLPKDSLVSLFSKQPFDFPTGDAQIYNNSAFFLLGLVIEKVSGVSYADYVEKHLFEPAGMNRSRYCDERAIQKGRAHGYDATPAGLVVKGYLDQTWPYAAGSLCSTAGDLIAWNRALHGGRILSAESYRELSSPSKLNDGTPLQYGTGIALTSIAGHRAIHHGGGINGYLSQSAYLPDDDVIVVVLINTAGPVSADDLAEKLVAMLLGAREVKGVELDHPMSDYEGTYRGAGRGATAVAKISRDSTGRLQLSVGSAPASPYTYVGNETFQRKSSVLTFKRVAGKVTQLSMDQGYGHYLLMRAP